MIEKLKHLNDKNIRVEWHFWGAVATASKEAFINAGIMQDGWFPGDEGCNKTSLRLVFDGEKFTVLNNRGKQMPRDENLISVTRYNKKFTVSFHYSEEEQNIILQRNKYERALLEEREKLNKLSINATHAKHKFLRIAIETQSYILTMINDGVDGYHLSDDAMKQLNESYSEALQVIKNSNLSFNRDERAAIESNIRAEKVELDDAFKSFLSKLGVST